MEYHLYDGNRVFTETVEVDPMDALPMNGVADAPPALSGGQMAQWQGGQWVIITELPPPPDPEPPAEAAIKPPSIIAQGRFKIIDFEVIGIDGQSSIAGGVVFDIGMIWCQFRDPITGTDYIVTPTVGFSHRAFVDPEQQGEDGFILCTQDLSGEAAFPETLQLLVTR